MVYLQRWHGWCHMKLQPSWHVLCTPNNHAPCHFMQSCIHKVHVYLAVTCQLHFWQNDRGLLCATVITWEWNRFLSKTQHRKLTLEKKILPHLIINNMSLYVSTVSVSFLHYACVSRLLLCLQYSVSVCGSQLSLSSATSSSVCLVSVSCMIYICISCLLLCFLSTSVSILCLCLLSMCLIAMRLLRALSYLLCASVTVNVSSVCVCA